MPPQESVRVGRVEKGDCCVELEPRSTGGIEIDLESSIKALFGRTLIQLTRETVQALGCEHAAIRLFDRGALDYVLQARLEAAVRQVLDVKEPGVLPKMKHRPAPPQPHRLRRSRLYLPGNQPDLALNAGLFGADSIILDLEDSVSPEAKDQARLLVRNTLMTVDFGTSERIVRINPLSTDTGKRDLDAILYGIPDTLLIPKCESAQDIAVVDQQLRELESMHQLDHPILLMPLIESAAGVLHAEDIATASDRVVALCFGAEDFTANIGVQRTREGRESFHARNQIVLAARAAGIQALDTVYSDVADTEGLHQSTLESIQLGFDGRGVIHPGQIDPVHRAFQPTQDQIETAQAIVQAVEEANRRGSGVASLGNKMIDRPVVIRAEKILAMARAAKQIPE